MGKSLEQGPMVFMLRLLCSPRDSPRSLPNLYSGPSEWGRRIPYSFPPENPLIEDSHFFSWLLPPSDPQPPGPTAPAPCLFWPVPDTQKDSSNTRGEAKLAVSVHKLS